MTQNQSIATMDHDEIVGIISDFYAFLVEESSLMASAIKIPPPEGWPEEYRQAFRRMDKSEEVVDLQCHLPYIADPDLPWLHETQAIDYTNR